MVIEKAPTIRVYSKTPCVQCGAVKRKLDKEGADYTVDDLTFLDEDTPEQRAEKENKLESLKALGYNGVPVTFVNDHHFYGFEINELSDAVARQRRAAMHVVPEAAVA
jgi:glutaredoxin-like protein NrdH